MKQKQRKFGPVAFVFLVICVLALVAVIYYAIDRRLPSKKRISSEDYFSITSSDEIGLTYGATVSDTPGRNVDGTIYLPYDAVHSLNHSFYYEEKTKTLIITTPTKVFTESLADGGASEDKKAEILDGTLYISLDLVKQYSDVAVKSYKDPAHVMVQTVFDYAAATVSNDAKLRKSASIKADIVADLKKNQTVRALDVSTSGKAENEKKDGWTRVLTSNGYIGYVQDENLGSVREKKDSHKSPIGTYTTLNDGSTINLAFHQTTSQSSNNALSTVLQNVKGVNTLAPTWFFLTNEQGNMKSLASKTYVDQAHAAGYKVWAVMNDFDGGVASSEATGGSLSTYRNRQQMIKTVIDGAKGAGVDGINVDFEHVNRDSAPAFLEMVRELSVQCRNNHLVLSIDNYVPTFTSYMGRTEQARVADYVVTMCYDEHASGAEEAGSVASLPFVRKGIQDTLKEVPASKVIAAIPFFTRLWTSTGSGKPASRAYGMSDAKNAAESLGMKLAWSESSGQNYGKIQKNGSTYQIWLEDDRSIKAKMQVIRKADIAGVAEWKLGQEDSGVWSVIEEGLK